MTRQHMCFEAQAVLFSVQVSLFSYRAVLFSDQVRLFIQWAVFFFLLISSSLFDTAVLFSVII
jgi:hypothetical protein